MGIIPNAMPTTAQCATPKSSPQAAQAESTSRAAKTPPWIRPKTTLIPACAIAPITNAAAPTGSIIDPSIMNRFIFIC